MWGVLRKSDPPKVSFARVKRQTLVSTLPTNGKVEPAEWQAVRAETGGVVSRAPVQDGQSVAAGAVMAEITDPSLQAEIDAAQAKLNEARANLATQEAGGKPAEFTDIDNNLARAQFDLAQAQKVFASLERLVAQHAATQQEADAAREKVQQSERNGRWSRPLRSRRPGRASAMPKRRSTWRGSARHSPWCARR